MKTLNSYTIYDKQSQSYRGPYHFPTDEVAVRSLLEMLSTGDQDNDLCKHPEDFTLFKNGMFCTSTGELECCEMEVIAKLWELKAECQ